MSVKKPEFVDSPYFVMEEDNWHLLPDAPPEIVKEFEEYIEYKKSMEKKGIDI